MSFREGNRFGGRNRSGGNRGGFGGNRFGNRDRGGDRRSFERKPVTMHDATCSKCGKECQVPFKPTGEKPILCNDCFRQNDKFVDNFNSKNMPSQSNDQLKEINAKLDKILEVLQDLELDIEEDADLEEDEDIEEIN